MATAPDYAVAHENLGDVYARLAAVEFEKASTLDKRNRTAAAKLKLIREHAGRLGPRHPCATHLYRAGRAAIRTTT